MATRASPTNGGNGRTDKTITTGNDSAPGAQTEPASVAANWRSSKIWPKQDATTKGRRISGDARQFRRWHQPDIPSTYDEIPAPMKLQWTHT